MHHRLGATLPLAASIALALVGPALAGGRGPVAATATTTPTLPVATTSPPGVRFALVTRRVPSGVAQGTFVLENHTRERLRVALMSPTALVNQLEIFDGSAWAAAPRVGYCGVGASRGVIAPGQRRRFPAYVGTAPGVFRAVAEVYRYGAHPATGGVGWHPMPLVSSPFLHL